MTAPAASGFNNITCTVRDGLRLYARHYPALERSKRRPVLCLAGLTRNSRDFHRLALALSSHPERSRNVFTLDTRGRGLSEYDKDWKSYTVPNEMQDVLDFMAMMELSECGIVGTSRGGLITMVMAAAQPARIGAVVLNDIGPVIEMQGLMRISGYVGRTPIPKSWSDAARVIKQLCERDFPNLNDEDALAFARQLFNEKDGKPAAGYDAKVARGFSVLDGPMPALWPQFAALKRVPVMVIRGANSDLLSEATVLEMSKRHPNCTSFTVPGEGHAPLLWDAGSQRAIAEFFSRSDAHQMPVRTMVA